MSIKFLLAASLVAASAVAPALAGEATIIYRADDLVTERGVAVTYKSVERQAASLCGAKQRQSVRAQANAQACVAEVVDGFVAAVDHELLTALHGEVRTVRLASLR